ncbi:MAG: ThiF family adenylyltransferase [Sediminibacterium sp.]|nr:ThiF family adenylyltransferase [Sediminibacterium sp.]
MKRRKLRMTGREYESIKKHLFPGDGFEAIAFALCGYLETDEEQVLTINSVYLYPHEKCTVRTGERVEWSPAEIVDVFEVCKKRDLRLLKIHSHPEYWPYFSVVDDKSDKDLSETVTGWVGRKDDVCSVIMLPDGSLMGRSIDHKKKFTPLYSIVVISDNIKCYLDIDKGGSTLVLSENDDEVQLRTRQTFGEGTTAILKKLKIAVVGCSGTGSIVAELLSRLGVGDLVLVDQDFIENKNVNRILNSTREHAKHKVYKTDMLKEAIEKMGTGVAVSSIPTNLHSSNAYYAVASCDVVFGCMDTVDGRYLLNRIATYFCSAYFDIGVRLDADGKGGINEILGRVDYLQPGLSSLLSRDRYTLDQLKAADLSRTDPEEYSRQVKEGYIKSANVESPAVISINMMFSSQAVTEFLARLHPFRDRSNENYAAITFSVSGFLLIPEREAYVDEELKEKIGLGHRKPLLEAPMLIKASNL